MTLITKWSPAHKEVLAALIAAVFPHWLLPVDCEHRCDGDYIWESVVWSVVSVQSIAVEGYETGEHAPGLKLKGTGAYRAAHHIIKVWMKRWFFTQVGDVGPVID